MLAELKERYVDIYRTLTKPRLDHRRTYMLLALAIFMLANMTDMGMMNIMILFVKHKPLFWSAPRFAFFNSINRFVQSIGTVLGIGVFKLVLKTKDSTIVIAALVFSVVTRAVLAAAKYSWMIYLTCAFQLFGASTLYPAMRVLIVKFASREEAGKVYATIAVLEVVGELIANLVFLNIYSATETVYSGVVFVIAAVVCFIALLFMAFLIFKTRNMDEQFMRNDSTEEDVEEKTKY